MTGTAGLRDLGEAACLAARRAFASDMPGSRRGSPGSRCGLTGLTPAPCRAHASTLAAASPPAPRAVPSGPGRPLLPVMVGSINYTFVLLRPSELRGNSPIAPPAKCGGLIGNTDPKDARTRDQACRTRPRVMTILTEKSCHKMCDWVKTHKTRRLRADLKNSKRQRTMPGGKAPAS